MKRLIFELVIGIIGLVWLCIIDWQITIAVVLILWSNNLMIARKLNS